ncbi:MAG: baseplate J/gp47 family protein [Planctomycetota bacterium]|nr:baseplate J/gp47 family protein [Planctomycetota bacterium]
MTTPDERKFITFNRGEIRDIILRVYRNQLRTMTDPDTEVTFTQDKIAQITQPGSRFYIEADGIDIVEQAKQASGLFLAGQFRPKWANTEMLEEMWGKVWLDSDDPKLPATGGSGTVSAVATPGAVWPGSTTIPDPTAAIATDANGKSYQVLYTMMVPASGIVTLTMKGIDVGSDTNPLKDAKLTWSSNQPVSAEAECTVTSDPGFSGGFNIETDAELADRIEQNIRHRPASGNNAHLSAWAREASVAVEQGWIFACAMNAGSVLTAITQKRNPDADPPEGPNIRSNPSEGTMLDVTSYLTPPGSAVVPERSYNVVTSPNPQSSDIVMRLSMSVGATAGWADVTPWPAYSTTYKEVIVTNIISATEFECETDDPLPGSVASLTGDDAPQLMLWNEDQSRYIELDVLTVTDAGITITVELNSAPSGYVIALGDRISPYTSQNEIVALACEEYFDELGPGEVIDSTDPRSARALRFPKTIEQNPSRAGEVVLSRVIDALAGVAADASLPYQSRNSPDLPGDVIDGPNMVTLGHVSVFPL